MQKFGWEPSKFLDMDPLERAVVIASIDVRCKAEKEKEAELNHRAKTGKGRGRRRRPGS